ncbi:MAG: hypothetical protein MZV64_49670 [Ignavibacteriales bacterium]|nr:hypothetical protein [Ignavibacteriales bacterium]
MVQLRARRPDRLAAHGRRGRLRQGRAPFRRLRPGPGRSRRHRPRGRSRSSTTRPRDLRDEGGRSVRLDDDVRRGEGGLLCGGPGRGPARRRFQGRDRGGGRARRRPGPLGRFLRLRPPPVAGAGRKVARGSKARPSRARRRPCGSSPPRTGRTSSPPSSSAAAEVGFQAGRDGGREERRGPRRPDRCLVRPPARSASGAIEASGRSRLSLRSARDRTVAVLAPKAAAELRPRARPVDLVRLGRRPGGDRGGRPARPHPRRGRGRVRRRPRSSLSTAGPGARPPPIPMKRGSRRPRSRSPRTGASSSATGGVACVLRRGEGRRAVGFFSPREDVAVSSDALEIRPRRSRCPTSPAMFSVSQGTDSLRADEIEIVGDTGEMRGRGGVRRSDGRRDRAFPGRPIELGGGDMSFAPGSRTLTLAGRGLRPAPGSAARGRDGLGRLRPHGRGPRVARGQGERSSSPKAATRGRGEAASYGAADDRLVAHREARPDRRTRAAPPGGTN